MLDSHWLKAPMPLKILDSHWLKAIRLTDGQGGNLAKGGSKRRKKGGKSSEILSKHPLGAILIKFGLDPIRDDQAVKKDGKNRVTLHLEQQNPSVFSGQNTG